MGKTEERNRMDIAGFCPEIVNRISNGNEPAGIGRNPDVRRLFFRGKSENAINSYLDLQKS